MKRDPAALADTEFDLVVIGGGIFGAWAALDAALRGLRVALVEQADFGGGTSANPYKIAHGGIRYIQHFDVVRVRHSSAERSALLRTAPHLVKPLPIVIPTFGRGKKSRWFLRTGTKLYDTVTRDRNEGIRDPDRWIPDCSSLDRPEVIRSFPGVGRENLTGGVRFHDGQVHSPPRLVWCVLRSAIEAGATACNYLAATGIVREGSRVSAVRVRDELDGNEFEVRTRSILNTAGAWTERYLRSAIGMEVAPPSAFSRDLCFVINRPWTVDDGLAITGKTHDPGAIVSRGARHIFLVPWRGLTLAGVWHSVRTEAPEQVGAEWSEIEEYLRELNACYPGQDFARSDVSLVNFGLVLFGRNVEGATHLRYGTRSRIIDHGKVHGVEGLHSLIGIRFTTGRADAAAAVRQVCRALGVSRDAPATDRLPVWGGDVPSFDGLVREIGQATSADLGEEVSRSMAHHHGSEYGEVFAAAADVPRGLEPLPGTRVLRAQVAVAARAEFAVRLEDALFRRTESATAADPGAAAIDEAAEIMAAECGWTESRTAEEKERVDAVLRRHLART